MSRVAGWVTVGTSVCSPSGVTAVACVFARCDLFDEEVCWVDAADVSRVGLGRAKVPQFVMPRTTPFELRIVIPAVLMMLELMDQPFLLPVAIAYVATYSLTSAILPGRTWRGC